MRFVSRGGTEPRRPEPRALNELTITLLHVAPRYFLITTAYGRRVGVGVACPRSFSLPTLRIRLHADVWCLATV